MSHRYSNVITLDAKYQTKWHFQQMMFDQPMKNLKTVWGNLIENFAIPFASVIKRTHLIFEKNIYVKYKHLFYVLHSHFMSSIT